MSFLARFVSANSRSLEKFELMALSSSATSKEKFLHGVWILVTYSYQSIRIDLPVVKFRECRFPISLGLLQA